MAETLLQGMIVIPARLDSSRFPGKVLADIAGKSLLQWTWELACSVLPAYRVIIATDSKEVADAARRFSALGSLCPGC